MITATIKTKDLKAAMKRLKPAYQRRNTIPILANTLLKINADQIAFTQTDLDLEIHHFASVAADGECSVTIPYPTLAGLASLDFDVLKFSVEIGTVDKLTVSADGFTMSINLLCPATDFPLMGNDRLAKFEAEKSSVKMAAPDLNRFLRMSAHCVSTEETRYYLNGVFICKSPENTMRAVTTDGHRLARIDSIIAWAGPEVILPRQACKALTAEKAGDISVNICADPLLCVINGDGWMYRAKLIDGKYPDYTRVIPEEDATISATISDAQIKKLMAMPDSHMSRAVKLSDGNMELTDYDGASVSVSAQISGPKGFSVGYNRKYLADQARITPTFRITTRNAGDPARIVGEDPLALFVLMPMRV